jgi:glycine/D-amino acid oxidase-like deaminating enzyme/nitrite reductase/ring-hydroxylating ferredoxin subunit
MIKKSIWKARSPSPDFSSLKNNIEVDVAIVGGGITGITTAHLLSNHGRKVAVLEAMKIGEGTTGDSTGNLYTMVDKRMHQIQSKFDDDTLKVVAESRTAAVSLIEDLTRKFGIACNFKRMPWYLFSESEKEDRLIEQEIAAARKTGLQVTALDSLPLPFEISSAMKIENQAQFNPAAYVKGFAKKINRQNCHIYANTPVLEVKKGSPFILTTPEGKITASKVVLATHVPKGVLMVQTVLGPYREYALAARLYGGDYPDGIFWSTDPGHHASIRSFKTKTDSYLLIIGEDHKVGQTDDHEIFFKRLDDYARRRFDISTIDYRWSAQHYKPADGLPYIGESSDEGIYIATGFSTDGLVYGTVAAMILSDVIAGRENPWAGTYDSKRFTPVASARKFLMENINVIGEYLKGFTRSSGDDTPDQVRPGEGKVMVIKNEKLAVHREKSGQLHIVSAVCPHMKCIVKWNNAEMTWDCPCHGSRFKATGEVIEGPAYNPLEKRVIG